MKGRRHSQASGSPAARVVGSICFSLFLLLTGVVFILPGHLTALDTWPHLVRQSIVADALRGPHLPVHSFEFYCGYPALQFYGPLFALLGGALMVLLGSGVLSLKLLLFGLHLGSGLAMRGFLRRRTGSVAAASLGAALYVSVPWRVLGLGNEGNYPQALVYLLLPLVFLVLDRVLDRPSARAGAFLGLVLGLCGLAHPVYAVFILLFVAVALAVRLRQPGPSRFLALAGVLGAGVAAGWLVPMLAEFRQFQYPQLPLGLKPLEPLKLFWFGARAGGYAGGYLSAVLLGLALFGGVTGLRRGPRRQALVATIGLALSLLLAFVAPRFEFTRMFLTVGLPPARFLVFYVFFAAALAGSGAAWLEHRVRRGPAFALVLAGLFVLAGADCLPFLLRVRYSSPEKFIPTRLKAYELLQGQGVVRLLDLPNHEDRVDDYARLAVYPATGFMFGGFASVLGPPYHQFAPPAMRYAYPWVNMVATDLGSPEGQSVPLRSLKALALLGVSHVITMPTMLGAQGRDSAAVLAKAGIAWDDRFVRRDAKPPLLVGRTGGDLLLASCRVEPFQAERLVPCATFRFADDWRALVDAVDIDPAARTMSFIPAAAGQARDSLPGVPGLRIDETEISHRAVRVRFDSRSECWLRIAVSWNPRLRVELDGRSTVFRETKDHFVYLRCPVGPHELRVTAGTSPLRSAMLVLSLLALVVAVVLAVRPGPRRR